MTRFGESPYVDCYRCGALRRPSYYFSVETFAIIDGFNLYNGVAKPLDCKWVNLKAFLTASFPSCNFTKIVFCTSMVQGPSRNNQSKYLDVLESSGVIVQKGRFEKRVHHCKVNICSIKGSYEQFTEKRTDALISALMVKAATVDNFEKIVLVSADSDFVPAVEICRDLGCEVAVLVPCLPSKYYELGLQLERNKNMGNYAISLRESASESKSIVMETFINSQFSSTVEVNSRHHNIPTDWRIAPPDTYLRMLGIRQKAYDRDQKVKEQKDSLESAAGLFLKSNLGLDNRK